MSKKTRELEAWEAKAEYDVGVLITRYLAEHPPPGRGSLEGHLASAGRDLKEAGHRHLKEAGVRPLSAIGGGA